MLQAITTKFLGPTDTKGPRIKAMCQAGSLTYSWNYELGVEGNHRKAAFDLQASLGWSEGNSLMGGWNTKEEGVWVQYSL